MTQGLFWALVGAGLLSMGLYALIVQAHLLRKVLALNVITSGVFMVLIGLARSDASTSPDPVPQAMVLTGIVVAVAATALALALIERLRALSGRSTLDEAPRD